MAATAPMAPLLELRGITKQFPGVLANDHIDLTLMPGEIHALLGENGAGKTTLMNILYGLYHADSGQLFVKGREVTMESPLDAIHAGIGMVHQHFMLIPVFTVTENVMLGVETLRNGLFLDRSLVAGQVRQISDKYGLDVDPDACVKDLSVGAQQRVEIVKTLYRRAEILILDEPTAVLTPQEVDEFFRILRSLVDQGVSVIFITHKLKEVMAVADRITVLRGGKVVGTVEASATNSEELARMMVGREVLLTVEKQPQQAGRPVLEVADLRVLNEHGQAKVDGVTFQVGAGEVLGIAGVQGNGQTELVEALTALRRPSGGSIRIDGQDTTFATPRQVLERGVAHVPEDRQRDGLVLSYPVSDNMVLNTYYLEPFATGISLHKKAIEDAASERAAGFDVRTPSIQTLVSKLSGGNQQKVIVAREFSRDIRLLIASQPTRGLDVGSIEYIHRRLIQKRDEGCAVLLVSPELDEVLALSDRIAVMYRGRIVDVVNAAEATREQVGLMMAGASPGPVVSIPVSTVK